MPTGETLYIGQPLSATVTHSLVTGSNGTGKSVAAANMALQDWLGGNAVLVIDPHGTLLDDILAGVPLEREGDIHILDMESKQPFQFNICRVGQGQGIETEVILAHMHTLSAVELNHLWQKQQQLDRWRRQQLMAKPWLIPDMVKRIKALSAATIGIPRWLSDMAYARKRVQSSPVTRCQRQTEQTYD